MSIDQTTLRGITAGVLIVLIFSFMIGTAWALWENTSPSPKNNTTSVVK